MPISGGFSLPPTAHPGKTAFLIDAEYFLRHLRLLRGDQSAAEAVDCLNQLWRMHLERLGRPPECLYRIFVYDCPPLDNKRHWPISRKALDLTKSPTYTFRTKFHEVLRVQRKVALRMGRLREKQVQWQLRPDVLRSLLAGKTKWEALADTDFRLDIEQSGVDMRIGLDIASLATRRLADQIVLVAGDADFIPAAKMARREGVDFLLDSMGAAIPDDLHEHIDGLQSVLTKADGTVPPGWGCR